ncbi:MAG: hypothetical protein BMS9Abin05_1650 [Rhodothermia bacterium]|nr:MAG: hypothetical protein BMS9Abin05_1650 [Rhodothermia bacterium]
MCRSILSRLILCFFLWIPLNAMAQSLDPTLYVGSWSGVWNNLTFLSTGAISVDISINQVQQTFVIVLDVDGSAFGGGDPPPETISLPLGEPGGPLVFVSPLFGTTTITFNTDGTFTVDSPNIPNAFVDSVNSVGEFTTKTFTLTLTINLTGGGTATTVVTARKQVNVIAAPLNLTAVANSPVNLSWTDASDNERGFEIERQLTVSGKSGVTFVNIGNTDKNVTAFVDNTAAPSTSYDYRVRAVNPDTTSGYSNIATVTTPAVNQSPAATDDAVAVNEDTPVDIDVLMNDLDPDGDPLTISVLGPPGHGQATVNDNGTPGDVTDDTILYTPEENYNGMDNFGYQVDDGNGGMAQANVAITVTPVNDAPTAENDQANSTENIPVDIDVLANDADVDGDPLTINIISQPQNGQAAVDDKATPGDPTDDTVLYTPVANFNGMDSFTYQVDDGNGGQAQATVDITIDPVNQPPAAFSMTTPPDGASITVGGGQGQNPVPGATAFTATWEATTDPDQDPLTYRWELMTSLQEVLFSQDVGGATQIETTVETIAAILTTRGVDLFSSLTLFHRAIASDGNLSTATAALSLTLTRGTLVGVDSDGEMPNSLVLNQNYPNPFYPSTTITYNVPRTSWVTIQVYDIQGRVISRLVEGVRPPGVHQVVFSAHNLPSGTYLYQMRSDGFEETRELILLRK